MDINTALLYLQTSQVFEGRQLHNFSKFYGDALSYISGGISDNILENITSILRDNIVINKSSSMNGKKYTVENLPNRRLLIYKYLQTFDYQSASVVKVKSLHDEILKYTSITTEIIQILNILNLIYKQKCFFRERGEILNIMYKISFNRDKRVEKLIMKVLDALLCKEDHIDDKKIIMNELFELSNFGMVEFFISSTLYKIIETTFKCSYITKLMKYVMQGFADNNLAFGASILFDTIILSLHYNDFVFYIDIFIFHLFQQYPGHSSRTMATSFAKYIVPICGAKYRSAFFYYTSSMHMYFRLIVCKHIFIAKSYLSNRELLGGILNRAARSCDENIVSMGFELLCHYNNSKILVTIFEMDLFKLMIVKLRGMTSSIKRSIQYFLSQISVCYTFHKTIANLPNYLSFYDWLIEFMYDHVREYTSFAEIISEVYCFAMELLLKPSTALIVPYTAAVEYEENPLYKDLSRYRSTLFHYSTLEYLHKIHISTNDNVPVVVNILKRLCSPYLFNHMMFSLFEKFTDILPVNLPWLNKKALDTGEILLANIIFSENFTTARFLKNLLTDKVSENVNKFMNATEEKEIENFSIAVHMQLLTRLVEGLALAPNGYIEENERSNIQISKIITVYNIYSKKYAFIHKYFKKNMEGSLIALVRHIFTIAKCSDYDELYIDNLLITYGNIINNVALKKVIVTASQYFHDMLKSTPQYRFKYLSFYKTQKTKYLRNITNLTLRKSAGIRNFMHIILKTIADPDFLKNEIEEFITPIEDENVDQLNLKLNILECLVSDTDLKQKSQQFIITIFEKALKNLNHDSFIVKNSSIQLVSVIATRLLGPLSESGNREFSAFDVFTVNPEFTSLIDKYLFDENSCFDVKLCILSFLAESNQDGHLCSVSCSFNINRLKEFFSDKLLCTHAVKAYVACCPTNQLYNILMEEFRTIDLGDQNYFKVNYEVEALCKLADRYMMAYPMGNAVILLEELDNLLHVWHSDNFAAKRIERTTHLVEKLSFIPKERLEENEEENDFSAITNNVEVNYDALSAFIQYFNNTINRPHCRCNINSRFITILLKYLVQNSNVTIKLILDVKEILNVFDYLDINIESILFPNLIKSFVEIDINIEEVFITIVCKKKTYSENDIHIVNNILEHCTHLIMHCPSNGKLDVILNIVESLLISDFVREINTVLILFITFSLTCLLNYNKQLSDVYFILTGDIRTSKSAMFLMLNNLELYLDNKISQEKLLKLYLKFLNSKLSGLHFSSIYSNPDEIMARIYFELKLNENLIFLLNRLMLLVM